MKQPHTKKHPKNISISATALHYSLQLSGPVLHSLHTLLLQKKYCFKYFILIHYVTSITSKDARNPLRQLFSKALPQYNSLHYPKWEGDISEIC